jgi:hypothetical protein
MTAPSFPPAFLAAVCDTLLPGDGVLPSARAAGVALRGDADAAVLEAIAAGAGGIDAFAAADPLRRRAIVADVEARDAPAFRAMLTALLQDYLESDAVMDALGWRTAPPQPQGHALAPTDAETWRRLDAVRRRGKIWREPT